MTSLASALNGPPAATLYQVDPSVAPAEIGQRAAADGWRFVVVECEGASDKVAVLDAFKVGLGLPEWFGHNLDALVDALRDVGFDHEPDVDDEVGDGDGKPTVVLWDRPDEFRATQPVHYAAIVDILAERAGDDPPRMVAIVRSAPAT